MAEEETKNNTEEPNKYPNSDSSTLSESGVPGSNPKTSQRSRRKKKAITVKVIQEKTNQPKIANIISAISALISLALGILTLCLYYQTKEATKLTRHALSHQITKDSNDNVNRIRKDTIDSIADAKKLKRDTQFINKQKRGIDAQIGSLKETQKEFEIENRPFMAMIDIKVDTPAVKKDLNYLGFITNTGKQPAFIIDFYYTWKTDTASSDYKISDVVRYPNIIKNVMPSGNKAPIYGALHNVTQAEFDYYNKVKPLYVYFKTIIKYRSFTGTKIYTTKLSYRINTDKYHDYKIMVYKAN